jgi:hypothetical protein
MFIIFEKGSQMYAWVGLDFHPPIYVSWAAGLTGVHYHIHLGFF